MLPLRRTATSLIHLRGGRSNSDGLGGYITMPALGSVKVSMRCRLVCVAHEASEICVAEVPGSACFSLLQHVVLGVQDVQ